MYKSRSLVLPTTILFLITTTMAHSTFGRASPDQAVQHSKQHESFLGKLLRNVQEHPLESLFIASATFMAGYAGFVFLKPYLRGDAVAPAIVAGPAAGRFARDAMNAGARHDEGRPERDRPRPGYSANIDATLAAALLESQNEHAFREKHQMRPVDHSLNIDIFRQLARIEDSFERVLMLQALLYDLEQRFVERGLLLAFVESVRRVDVDAAIEAFQELARQGWSLLQLAPSLGELDPHRPVQMLDFRTLLAHFNRLQALLAQGAPIATARLQIESIHLHPFDRAILDLATRYWWELAGNEPVVGAPITPETHERMRLIVEQLLGLEFRPLPRIEALLRAPNVVAAAAIAPVPPPRPAEASPDLPPLEVLPLDELRRRRMEFLKKREEKQ